MSLSTIVHRIQALRETLSDQGLQAYVALSADPHLSEYLPEHWQGRQWLSGFHGSAGTLVVAHDAAALWTDSRYWEQAEASLKGTGIQLMRQGSEGVDTPQQWLAHLLDRGARVNIPGQVLSVQAHELWKDALAAEGIVLVTGTDALSAVWHDRPDLPCGSVWQHEPPFACRTRPENLRHVRTAMAEHGAQWWLVSSLDDIAWLLNLRGNDIPYNPVFTAYLLVGAASATLFADAGRFTPPVLQALQSDGVQVQPYEDCAGALACLSETQTMLFDPARTTIGLLQSAAFVNTKRAPNPSQLLKACKNTAEIANVRHTMEHDGAALCEFFAWFEDALQAGQAVTELDIDTQITAARARRPNFVSPSFSTIAAWNANGAMPHYHATAAAHAVIRGDGLLLIDSGGQYLGGTTDITRVVPVGTLTPEHRVDFTVVLKGMIALSMACFPKGTAAPVLDAIARLPIWQAGADYGHGTGHGVGYFMNVHEGPQSIAYRASITPHMAMQVGMITSNEPGLYRPGRWGIRIENLILAVPVQTTEFGDFLGFETLTLCPIDTRCIETTLLSPVERQWLNAYHTQVRERLQPLVQGRALEWLLDRTQSV